MSFYYLKSLSIFPNLCNTITKLQIITTPTSKTLYLMGVVNSIQANSSSSWRPKASPIKSQLPTHRNKIPLQKGEIVLHLKKWDVFSNKRIFQQNTGEKPHAHQSFSKTLNRPRRLSGKPLTSYGLANPLTFPPWNRLDVSVMSTYPNSYGLANSATRPRKHSSLAISWERTTGMFSFQEEK